MEYDVSVLVVTYHSDWKKLISTLRSILLQQDVSVEIVISDDGSENNYFSEIEEFFEQNGFQDFCLNANEVNRGTVCNLMSGLEKCKGTYVKTISPGDMLGDERTLARWCKSIKENNAEVSFSDAIYYCERQGEITPVKSVAHPQKVDCYIEGNADKIRYNYLICDDLFLGAALLCKKTTLIQYVQEICGKVVYAEDNAYRLMAYDRVPVSYFPENAVIYEVGSGVSTSGSDIWRKRLADDWETCNRLLLNRCDGKTLFDKQVFLMHGSKGRGIVHKVVKTLYRKTVLFLRSLHKRYTSEELPKEFMKKIML